MTTIALPEQVRNYYLREGWNLVQYEYLDGVLVCHLAKHDFISGHTQIDRHYWTRKAGVWTNYERVHPFQD